MALLNKDQKKSCAKRAYVKRIFTAYILGALTLCAWREISVVACEVCVLSAALTACGPVKWTKVALAQHQPFSHYKLLTRGICAPG